MLATMRDRLLAAAAASLLLSACAGTKTEPQGAARDAVPATREQEPRAVSTPDAPGNEAARLAMQMIVVPYR